mmetsp:Transcript_25134/g.47251  ORF Transcript_25134/g.47251 Transcript_25134/m.47251 type:complete len:234 (-) Transcript_25134:375-1076(-)
MGAGLVCRHGDPDVLNAVQPVQLMLHKGRATVERNAAGIIPLVAQVNPTRADILAFAVDDLYLVLGACNSRVRAPGALAPRAVVAGPARVADAALNHVGVPVGVGHAGEQVHVVVDLLGGLRHGHAGSMPRAHFANQKVIVAHGTLQPLTGVPFKPVPAGALPRGPVAETEPRALHPVGVGSLNRRRRVCPRSAGGADSQRASCAREAVVTLALVANLIHVPVLLLPHALPMP